MQVPVIRDVNKETLGRLLDEGCESETLDFKRYCDLSNKPERVELAKDVAAMQIEGGYIVIGADDHGKPSGEVTQQHLRSFEQASLRNMMLTYLAEPLDLLAKCHVLDGNLYVLIYVGASDDCLSIIKSHGHNAKGETVFQPGDVFARHGTASERWNQRDRTKIGSRIVAREKERWAREVAESWAERIPSSAASAIASGAYQALSWQLDGDTFIDVVVEQVRKRDPVPLRLFLSGVPADVGAMLPQKGTEERIETVLDRLTCLAALMLRLGDDDLFHLVAQTLVEIYNLPIGGDGLSRRDLATGVPELSFMILQRIIGIGALAERRKRWDIVRLLVLQRGRGYDFQHYRNWYRHALVRAANANLLNVQKGEHWRRSSLLSFAQTQVQRLACLRPDLPSDDEELLNSICRFDLLACLIGIDDYGGSSGSAYYPNFSSYSSYRSIPAVEALLEHPEMRATLFHGSDEKLAETLREIDRTASHEGFTVWDGFYNTTIERFLKEHPPES